MARLFVLLLAATVFAAAAAHGRGHHGRRGHHGHHGQEEQESQTGQSGLTEITRGTAFSVDPNSRPPTTSLVRPRGHHAGHHRRQRGPGRRGSQTGVSGLHGVHAAMIAAMRARHASQNKQESRPPPGMTNQFQHNLRRPFRFGVHGLPTQARLAQIRTAMSQGNGPSASQGQRHPLRFSGGRMHHRRGHGQGHRQGHHSGHHSGHQGHHSASGHAAHPHHMRVPHRMGTAGHHRRMGPQRRGHDMGPRYTIA